MSEWFELAPPKSSSHWQDGRSAKDSAQAWLTAPSGALPPEIQDALCSHADLGPLLEWSAEPEALVPFDSYSGPANVDVLLVCHDSQGPLVVAVEAKSDETFAKTIEQTLEVAERRVAEAPNSRGVARIEELSAAILGVTPGKLESVGPLRYQLLTVTAAALAEADRRGTDRAVVLIHEFVTDRTSDDLHRLNDQDLQSFWGHLGGTATEPVHSGVVRGPVSVPGAPKIRLYFGKAQRWSREAPAKPAL